MIESSKQLNILYSTLIDISLPNGPGVNEREFIASIRADGTHNLRVIASKPKYSVSGLFESNDILLSTYNYKNPFFFLLQEMNAYRKIHSLLQKQPFDLLIIRLSLFPIAYARIASLYNIPLYLKHFPGDPELYLHNRKGITWLIGKSLSPIHKYLLTYLAQKSAVIDTCTEEHAIQLRNKFPGNESKILIVPNAVNTQRFHPRDILEARKHIGLERFHFLAGYIGGMPWERGGKELILAAPALMKRFEGLGILIVGGGGRMGELKDLAEHMNISDRVVFSGEIPYEKVPLYVNALDVGIALDQPARLLKVGNSNQKIRQYISSGKPVVTIETGNQFIRDQGLGSIVERSNILQITEELSRWMKMLPSEKESHSQRAHQYAKNNLTTGQTWKNRLQFIQKKI